MIAEFEVQELQHKKAKYGVDEEGMKWRKLVRLSQRGQDKKHTGKQSEQESRHLLKKVLEEGLWW